MRFRWDMEVAWSLLLLSRPEDSVSLRWDPRGFKQRRLYDTETQQRIWSNQNDQFDSYINTLKEFLSLHWSNLKSYITPFVLQPRLTFISVGVFIYLVLMSQKKNWWYIRRMSVRQRRTMNLLNLIIMLMLPGKQQYQRWGQMIFCRFWCTEYFLIWCWSDATAGCLASKLFLQRWE